MTLLDIFQNKSQFATRKVGSEMVLVPLKNNIAHMDKLFTMNEVACFIWENIDGQHTKDEILASITEAFDIDIKTAEIDYVEFIESITNMMNE